MRLLSLLIASQNCSLKNIKQHLVFQMSTLFLDLAIDITDSFIISLKPPRSSLEFSFPPSLHLGYKKSYFSKVEMDPQFFLLVLLRERFFPPNPSCLSPRSSFPLSFLLESRKSFFIHLLFFCTLDIYNMEQLISNRFIWFSYS